MRPLAAALLVALAACADKPAVAYTPAAPGVSVQGDDIVIGDFVAKRRAWVISDDTIVEGIRWPAGSTLIGKDNARGCRAEGGFCLAEVKLPHDDLICDVPVPQDAQIYVDYVRETGERGVFVLVRGAGHFQLNGVKLRQWAISRCDTKASERLRGGELDEERVFRGERFSPGVVVDFYPPERGGGLARAWFHDTPATFRGLSLPKGSMVDFAADGTVTSYRCYERADLQIQGLTCHIGFSDYARVYPDGKLASCELFPPRKIGAVTARNTTTFHPSGAVASTVLDAEIVIDGVTHKRGEEVVLGPGGELISFKPPKWTW